MRVVRVDAAIHMLEMIIMMSIFRGFHNSIANANTAANYNNESDDSSN
jgi:hypothetical protein